MFLFVLLLVNRVVVCVLCFCLCCVCLVCVALVSMMFSVVFVCFCVFVCVCVRVFWGLNACVVCL